MANALAVQEQEIIGPPEIGRPRQLDTLKDVRNEMGRIYRATCTGRIPVEISTRLIYMLDRMSSSMKAEADVAEQQKAYAEAWNGVKLIGPGGDDDA